MLNGGLTVTEFRGNGRLTVVGIPRISSYTYIGTINLTYKNVTQNELFSTYKNVTQIISFFLDKSLSKVCWFLDIKMLWKFFFEHMKIAVHPQRI